MTTAQRFVAGTIIGFVAFMISKVIGAPQWVALLAALVCGFALAAGTRPQP